MFKRFTLGIWEPCLFKIEKGFGVIVHITMQVAQDQFYTSEANPMEHSSKQLSLRLCVGYHQNGIVRVTSFEITSIVVVLRNLSYTTISHSCLIVFGICLKQKQ